MPFNWDGPPTGPMNDKGRYEDDPLATGDIADGYPLSSYATTETIRPPWYENQALYAAGRTLAALGLTAALVFGAGGDTVQSEERPDIVVVDQLPVKIDLSESNLQTTEEIIEKSPFREGYLSSKATLDTSKPAPYRDPISPELHKKYLEVSAKWQAQLDNGERVSLTPEEEKIMQRHEAMDADRARMESLEADRRIEDSKGIFLGAVTGTRSGVTVNYYRSGNGDYAQNTTMPISIDPRALDNQLDWVISRLSAQRGDFIPKDEVERIQRLASAGKLEMTLTVIIAPDPELCFPPDDNGKPDEVLIKPKNEKDCTTAAGLETDDTEFQDRTDSDMRNPIIFISAQDAPKLAGEEAIISMTSDAFTARLNQIGAHEKGHAIVGATRMTYGQRFRNPKGGQDVTEEHRLLVNPIGDDYLSISSRPLRPGRLDEQDPAITPLRFLDPAEKDLSKVRAEIESLARHLREHRELKDVIVFPDALVGGSMSEVIFKLPSDDEGDTLYDRSANGHAFALDSDQKGDLTLKVIELGVFNRILPDQRKTGREAVIPEEEAEKLRPYRDTLKVDIQYSDKEPDKVTVVNSAGIRHTAGLYELAQP